MKIGVCIKAVPESNQTIRINPSGIEIIWDGMKWMMNPYDQSALEEALRIKDLAPETEVTLYSIGCEASSEILRTGLAMGADRAVLAVREQGEYLDGLTTAHILYRMLETNSLDMIFMGKQAIDTNAHEVVSILGGLSGLRHVTDLIAITLTTDSALLTRESPENGKEILQVTLPCICGFCRGINEPRYPSLKGLVGARKKELKRIEVSELLGDTEIFQRGVSVHFAIPVEPVSECEILQGSVEEAVSELLRRLRFEKKILAS